MTKTMKLITKRTHMPHEYIPVAVVVLVVEEVLLVEVVVVVVVLEVVCMYTFVLTVVLFCSLAIHRCHLSPSLKLDRKRVG